jgi:glycine cleavage system H protein
MTLEAGKPLGTAESVKSVNGFYVPVSGGVIEVNAGLKDAPEKVTYDPMGHAGLSKCA